MDQLEKALAHQLFASYARAIRIRVLASVMGVEGLPENDRKFLEFADAFEQRFVSQEGPRTLEQSMDLGWELLRALPPAELTRLSSEQLEKFVESAEKSPEEAPPAGEGAEPQSDQAPAEAAETPEEPAHA